MVSPLRQGAKRSTREFAMICRPSAWAHDKNLAVSTLLNVWLVNEGPKMQGHETPCKNVASICDLNVASSSQIPWANGSGERENHQAVARCYALATPWS